MTSGTTPAARPDDPEWQTFLTKWGLILLPSLACIGPILQVVGPMFGYRILVGVLLALAVLAWRNRPSGQAGQSFRGFLILAAVWLAWGVLSQLWVRSRSASLRELISVVVGLGVLAALGILVRDRQRLTWFRWGWVIAFVFTGAIAGIEIITNFHLANYFVGLERWRIPSRMPASTFGNSNNYAAFVVAATPFLAVTWIGAKGTRWRLPATIALVLSFPLIFFTGSRLCLVAMIVIVLYLLFRVASRKAVVLALVATMVWMVAPFVLPETPLSHLQNPSEQTSSENQQKPGDQTGTNRTVEQNSSKDILGDLANDDPHSTGGGRRALYENAIWMIGHTRGRGVGPGQYSIIAATDEVPRNTGTQVSPHSLIFEVLSEYGVLVGLLAAWFLASIVLVFRRNLRRFAKGSPEDAWQLAGLMAAIALIFAGFASSSFLIGNISWLSLSPLIVVPAALWGAKPATLGGDKGPGPIQIERQT